MTATDLHPKKPLFTVFTPTFNRAHTMDRPYRSLCAQTLMDFEWLVIDDGSTDNTSELFEEWQAEAKFPIRYYSQENRGKHVAFNRAVALAQGEFFLTLDSDDECVPHALERFLSLWKSIAESEREKFSAVTCLCVDQNGAMVGDKFPMDVMDSNALELRYRHRVRGEKWGFQRTDVLRRFPYPEPPGMRYLHLSLVWNAISRRYLTRYVNEALRIYHMSTRPDDSLTTETNQKKHAAGQALSYRSLLNDDLQWARYAPSEFAKTAVLYTYYSFLSGSGVLRQFADLRGGAQLIWMAAMPLSLYKYTRDRRQLRFK